MNEEEKAAARRASETVGFCALGVLSTTQALARTCLDNMDGADPEVVAEETLCLIAVATLRAAEVGLREKPAVAAAALPALALLPFSYSEYVVGSAMIADDDPSLAEQAEEVRRRLGRKCDFYAAQFPANQFPGPHALGDKMPFWMGRVSPPGLPQTPIERLGALGLAGVLQTHLQVVLAFCRRP